MKKVWLATVLAIMVSCNNSEVTPELDVEGEKLTLIKNSSSVNHVSVINEPAGMANLSTRDLNTDDQYFWTHIAHIDHLEVNGISLSATSISLENNIAYVSYHKRGDIHIGALELIDLTTPGEPESLGFIPFPHTDINAVYVDPFDPQVIWVAGSSQKIGAALYKLSFNSSHQLIDNKRINLSKALNGSISASANGIYCDSNYIYVSAGKSNGGTFIVNRFNLEEIRVDEYYGAKGIAGNEKLGATHLASLAVDESSIIKVTNTATDNTELIFQTSAPHQTVDLPHDGKYDLQFSPVNPLEIYYTSASTGVQSLNINTGQLLKNTSQSLLSKGNTNSLFIDDKFIYLANGEDGLSIASLESAETTSIIAPIFHWDLAEKPASVNFVTARDGYVFVAKGLGGFHILRYEEQEAYKSVLPFDRWGTPIGMVDRDFCPQVIQNILTKALPEGQNALVNSPEYFSNPNSSFYLEEEAEVEVTFLHEGAGFRNTIGYYTYNVNNPPSSIDELDKTIIFPNASAQGSGGGLIPGNTVEVLGTFPKGTVFGFYLVSYGWRHELTEGFYTQYSDKQFNQNDLQQNLIFYDQQCDAFVVCFEDILIPGGDKDFNDAIFQVTSSPSDAFRKSSYLQIR